MTDELYCLGCGIKLQCEDENKEGYVNPNAFNREFILCKRCYQLKHYGKFSVSKKVKNTINLLHESAKKDDLIVLICDVALCYTPLIKVLKELNSYSNVIMVANRYDLYKDYISLDKAYLFLNRQIKANKLKINDVFIIDNNINQIFDYIDYNSKNSNVYLLGLENAGKTTFINNILKIVSKEDKNFLTNSKYPGTTVDLIKIPLDDKTCLIDSPGIHSKGNMLSYVSKEFISKLHGDDKIKPIIFQLNPYQSLLVSNVLKFDFLKGDKQSVVFYGSSMLEITRCKYEKSNTTFKNRIETLHLKESSISKISDLQKYVINISEDKKFDIVIEGFGFFTVKKGSYVIYTVKSCNVFVRQAMI